MQLAMTCSLRMSNARGRRKGTGWRTVRATGKRLRGQRFQQHRSRALRHYAVDPQRVLGGPGEVAGDECRSLVRQRAGVGGRIVRGEIHPVRAHKVLGSAHVERLRLIQRADHH